MLTSALKYQVSIYQRTEATDTTGDTVFTNVLYKTVWAGVKYESGNESREAEQVTASVKVRFQIRYNNNITEKMHIVYDGQKFDIDYIEKIGRETMFLHTTKLLKQ
jgi:SPP1 family predicted phage head-tail adaptor